MGHWLITAALVVFGVVAALGAALLKKLVTTELEARLGKLPELAFWIALRTYPQSERETRYAEWADDYQEILDATSTRPLTRLAKTLRFCTDLAMRRAARSIRASREAQKRRRAAATAAEYRAAVDKLLVGVRAADYDSGPSAAVTIRMEDGREVRVHMKEFGNKYYWSTSHLSGPPDE